MSFSLLYPPWNPEVHKKTCENPEFVAPLADLIESLSAYGVLGVSPFSFVPWKPSDIKIEIWNNCQDREQGRISVVHRSDSLRHHPVVGNYSFLQVRLPDEHIDNPYLYMIRHVLDTVLGESVKDRLAIHRKDHKHLSDFATDVMKMVARWRGSDFSPMEYAKVQVFSRCSDHWDIRADREAGHWRTAKIKSDVLVYESFPDVKFSFDIYADRSRRFDSDFALVYKKELDSIIGLDRKIQARRSKDR